MLSCSSNGNNRQLNQSIKGAVLEFSSGIVDEICRAAESQQLSRDNKPNLNVLTPIAAAMLALLSSCVHEDIYFTIIGSDGLDLLDTTLPASTVTTTGVSLLEEGDTSLLELPAIGLGQASINTLGPMTDQIPIRSEEKSSNDIRPISSVCKQLAASLLILGFPHVSIVAACPLHRQTRGFIDNGFSCLFHELLDCGVANESGVLRLPQDIVLAHKVHQFSYSSDEKSKSENEFVLSNSSASLENVFALDGLLRKLGGLQDGFIESVLLRQKCDSPNKTTAISSGGPASNTYCSAVDAILSRIQSHASTQSRANGKLVLNECRRVIYPIAPIADDTISLHKKIRYAQSNIDISFDDLEAIALKLRSKLEVSK